MAEEKQRELRVVMIPWLAHGHITPFVELAKSLASNGLKIFFVSTPLNIRRIKPQICDAPGIELVELAMPSVEGLPPGVESTADAAKTGEAPLLIPLLRAAMDLLERPFEELLQQLSPNVVIHDFAQHWVPRVANPIPAIFFFIMSITSFSFGVGQLEILPRNPTAQDLIISPPGFPSQIIQRRLFEAERFLNLYQELADGLSISDRTKICVRESWAIAFNTCLELEGVYVEYLQRLMKQPVIPVGLLMPKLPSLPADDICLKWLDRQPAASVVVLSFGSEYVLTHQDLTAIAMGLLESSVSFLWVLPAGNDLLQGFQDQIGDKGLVVTKWAPQLHILNDPSTCAFVTHCGWNSMTEGLRFGVPLITLPMQYEQGLNAKLVQELKVGVEVRRNEEDGSFTKEDISKAIRVLMIEEEGSQIKYNVTKISSVLTSNNFEVTERNMRNFISMLRTLSK
ncbi:UDP-glycosyltransferase 91C1-like [Cryptomeria japonica]|uniref:UDP-glycosyltransferase 91C1-like n=1 Tax=Cryptomeria japonica TaxID=3369 RepID=UPI0027D9DDE0|nr:UDP-glycosyltransferase 91C1-like [Cryptomeria japonica]